MQPDKELILVRHGRSAHVERAWLDVEGVRRWMVAYDAAALAVNDAPPAELVALAASASRVFASDLPRAIASALLIAPTGVEIIRTPLLREAPLECESSPLPTL